MKSFPINSMKTRGYVLVDESEKGKLALNYFYRRAILQCRHGTRKKITLATSICGNTLLRRWM